MNSLGIFHGKDLKKQSLEFLTRNFGKSGKHFYEIVRGIQDSEVKPNRIRKSIAAERTFTNDLHSKEQILEKIESIAEELEKRIQKSNVKGKTITVKIKHHDFTIQSRSKTTNQWNESKKEILEIVTELINQNEIEKPVRLLGISMSNLNTLKKKQEMDIVIQLKIDFPDKFS